MKMKKFNPKIIIFLLLIFIIIFIIFLTFNYKKLKVGNNILDKSKDGIENYILNISSYETTSEIEINSNKNSNKYIIKQYYSSGENVCKQEVLEPSNIQNLIMIYDGNDLKIENTKLNLTQIYENYNGLTSNNLCLHTFINDYKSGKESQMIENDKYFIMQIKTKNDNKYMAIRSLYIEKETGNIEKMEVKDVNEKITAYIKYKEIKLNSISKEEILAVNMNMTRKDV